MRLTAVECKSAGYAEAVPERPKRRATIRELAEYTGLSPAAVSYALRGMQVSAETEERVRAAADELGYEADPIARALRGGATAVVGLLVGSLADFWNQELVRAVRARAARADRSTLVADADGEPEPRARARAAARGPPRGRPDRPAGRPGQRRLGADRRGGARRSRSATRCPASMAVGEVVFDNDRGVEDTLRHLSSLGHRRVAVLSWAVETSPGRPAERAVAEVAAALGLDCRIVPCAYSLNGSRPLALELLSADDRPTAMFCMSDSIAYGVYVACAELGLTIPDDVSVAGFGDHPISRLLAPPLTSTVWDVERSPSWPPASCWTRWTASGPTNRGRGAVPATARRSVPADRAARPDLSLRALVRLQELLGHRRPRAACRSRRPCSSRSSRRWSAAC